MSMDGVSKLVAVVLLTMVTSGCTTALPPEKVEAIGPAFNEEVKKGYLQLARNRSQFIVSSDRYYDKARAAMLGDEVWPDKVASRDIAPGLRPEALALRARLVAALEGNARTNVPVEAAAAQTNFDCWLDQLERRPGSNTATTCREGFMVALAAAEAAAAGADLPPAFVVLFDSGRTNLDSEALTVVEEAALSIEDSRATRVEVIGYADRSGDPASNERLARRRAEVVAAALARAGIGRDVIEVRSGGAVGVRDDQQSRRVEIVASG